MCRTFVYIRCLQNVHKMQILWSYTQRCQFIKCRGSPGNLHFYQTVVGDFDVGGPRTIPGEDDSVAPFDMVTVQPGAAWHSLVAWLLLKILQQRSSVGWLYCSLTFWNMFWIILNYNSGFWFNTFDLFTKILLPINEYARAYLVILHSHNTCLARTLWLDNRGGAAYSPSFEIQMKC